jgi:hypothetical protein
MCNVYPYIYFSPYHIRYQVDVDNKKEKKIDNLPVFFAEKENIFDDKLSFIYKIKSR